MTADQYRRDLSVSPARRERVRRMLLSPDELRAEDEAEEALLREVAEDAMSEAKGRGTYPGA